MKHLLIFVWVGWAAANLIIAAPVSAASDQWTGTIRVDNAPVYVRPGGTSVGVLEAGAPVTVSAWLRGPEETPDNFTWADIGDNRFVHSSVLLHSPLPASPPTVDRAISDGHWADANLSLQILTLYDGGAPVRMALMNSGRPGGEATESHPGIWPISRRVADETMRGDGYDIPDVLFTQYFTADAEAIHLNYWLTDEERGIPRSHGCLGLAYSDAQYAWEFLGIGSPVSVHQ